MNLSGQEATGYRLSSQQAALCHDQLWNIAASPAMVIEISHPMPVDQQRLRACLLQLIDRHEVLRTAYRSVAGLRYPLQYIGKTVCAWQEISSVETDAEAIQVARESLDSACGVLLSCVFVNCSRIALTGWGGSLDATSLSDLACRWIKLYEGAPDIAPDLEIIQYADYAAWQNELFKSEIGKEGAAYWAQRLQQRRAPQIPAPVSPPASDPVIHEQLCDTTVSQTIRSLAGTLEVTTESLIFAAWCAFWARLTSSETLWIDWHAHVRPAELGDALGRFSIKLPIEIHTRLSQSFTQLVRHAAESRVLCQSWQECFDGASLFGAASGECLLRGLEFEGIEVSALPAGFAAKAIDAGSCAGRLKLEVIIDRETLLFRWRTHERALVNWLGVWANQFAVFLSEACRQPQRALFEFGLTGVTERQQLAAFSRSPDFIHHLIQQQVERTPHATAVICGEQRLSYLQLQVRSNAVAAVLRERGIVPDQPVGVHLDRAVEVVIAILGVLQAGAAYVPLDADYPAERIMSIVDDAGCRMVVTNSVRSNLWSTAGREVVCIDGSPSHATRALPPVTIHPEHLAYLIYTSGSTGRPKGVMVSHANAVASTLARWRFYADRVQCFLLLSSFSFDSSVAGLFWTLSQGGALAIPTDAEQRDPQAIVQLLRRHAVSHLLTVPALYSQILANLRDCESLLCAIVAGETCHADIVSAHRARCPGVALVNEYGPTEATVWCTAYQATPRQPEPLLDTVPIGRPIPFSRVYLLDEHLVPCAIGMAGELYVGGAGISRGYWLRAALSAERFVADPFEDGARLYRTGDLARFLPTGDIEYLGRIDHQVKIRGYRIELGEVESLLRKQEPVSEAIAVATNATGPDAQLVAYVVPRDASQAEMPAKAQSLRDALLAWMRHTVPGYMVPARLRVVRDLPRTPNGKVDRQALQARDASFGRPDYAAPRTEIEQALAQIWESILKVTPVGLNDNFFDLGGHSLLATQVTARVRQMLLVDLPLRELFEASSLQTLAGTLSARMEETGEELLLMEQLVAAEGETPA